MSKAQGKRAGNAEHYYVLTFLKTESNNTVEVQCMPAGTDWKLVG